MHNSEDGFLVTYAKKEKERSSAAWNCIYSIASSAENLNLEHAVKW